MSETQIAKSFDKATLIKIGKGALIAMTAGASLYGLEYFGQLQVNNPVLMQIAAVLIPILVNVIKEWYAGTKI